MISPRFAPARTLIRPRVWFGLLALAVAGCQSRGDVSGTVTFKDKPLVYGTVLFVCSDGASVQAMIQKDGTYSASGLAIGDAQVAVNSPNPKSIGIFTTWKDPAKKPPPLEVPGWFAIPARYGDAVTSKLTVTIKGGANPFDIALK
jgi:hypothetical protein